MLPLNRALTTYHDSVLAIAADLVKLDPPLDSPEGKLLVTLARAIELYEKSMYPLEELSPRDRAAIDYSTARAAYRKRKLK